MLKRFTVVASMVFVCAPLLAGDLQRDVRSRWLGAWVVMDVETYSDCAGRYTNNRVNGNLVRGHGSYRFQPGELAKVDGVDLKRSRLDLMLTVPEPLLVSYEDGPFTLYREVGCKIELEYEVPRSVVKNKEIGAIEAGLVGILERHSTESDAIASDAWNGRLRQQLPDDYETTLALHAAWKAEQFNATVDAKLDQANEVTLRLADRVTSDPDYLAGFAEGVEHARGAELHTCSQLIGVGLTTRLQRTEDEAVARHNRGEADGRHFVWGLEMIRTLPGCYVEVPAVDSVAEVEVIRKSYDDSRAASD